MNDDSELLQRYLDGELSAAEVAQVQARLEASPELAERLRELERVGELVRLWAGSVQGRADQLLEPTLRRVHAVERQRSRHTTLGFALAAVLVAALPFASQAHFSRARPAPLLAEAVAVAPAAAIERLEAGNTRAQVFVLGGGTTPVVWLADDAADEGAGSADQDPG